MGILLMTWPSLAQDPHRVHRGAIVDVDMPTVEIETRDGQHFNVTVSESTRLFVVTPGQQDELNEGQFVGITSIMEQDGRHVALKVHYAWDLVDQPNMMTNATIAEITMIDDHPRLTVMYGQDSDQPRGDGRVRDTARFPFRILGLGRRTLLAVVGNRFADHPEYRL